jgi:cyclic AMP-responsive element-binding protein 3
MDLGSPDLPDALLEPPEDIFSTGSFLELGLNCSPPQVPVIRLQEQGLQGWESSGSHGCVSVTNGSGSGVETQVYVKKPKRLQGLLRKKSENRLSYP